MTRRLTLDIDDDLHQQFRVHAATTGIPMVSLVQALLRDFLDADEGDQERVHAAARRVRKG